MTGLKIAVADDNESIATGWKEDIRKVAPEGSDVFALTGDELADACEKLKERRTAARSDKPLPNGTVAFDGSDIAVLDYDLLDVTNVTGAQIAYLLRAYSDCDVIVELNRYGNNSFDLNLDGRAGDYSDLLLGSEQLGNAGLWKRQWRGYRPWHWPLLPLAPEASAGRVASVLRHLDEPILDVLEFPSDVREALPRDAIEFILHPGKDDPSVINEVTFRQFVDHAPGGIEAKDRLADDESYARVASARVSIWLNRIIVPRQDILVDAPHLASRYPSLLKDKGSIDDWNKTTRLGVDLSELGLNLEPIAQYEWKSLNWVSAPVWFWPQLSRDENILEISRPAERAENEYVFCEDIAAFLPRDAAQDFRSELSTPFRRRFIAKPESSALAKILADVKDGPEDPARVEYTPKIALAY